MEPLLTVLFVFAVFGLFVGLTFAADAASSSLKPRPPITCRADALLYLSGEELAALPDDAFEDEGQLTAAEFAERLGALGKAMEAAWRP